MRPPCIHSTFWGCLMRKSGRWSNTLRGQNWRTNCNGMMNCCSTSNRFIDLWSTSEAPRQSPNPPKIEYHYHFELLKNGVCQSILIWFLCFMFQIGSIHKIWSWKEAHLEVCTFMAMTTAQLWDSQSLLTTSACACINSSGFFLKRSYKLTSIFLRMYLTKFAAKKPCREFLVTINTTEFMSCSTGWHDHFGSWLRMGSLPQRARDASVQLRCSLVTVLLMVQKSGDHQLRLVLYPLYPVIYGIFYIPAGAGFNFINKVVHFVRGSNTLFLAERLPSSLVVGVSNSHGQRGNDTQSAFM